MTQKKQQRLDSPWFNEWRLLALIAGTISGFVIVRMSGLDLSLAENVSAMIAYSVRWAVPWLYIAFAASSVQALFPSTASRWLLRNRKIMGLSFAVGMAWQLTFIVWLVSVHRDYYVNEVYVLRDVIEGLGGYLFLLAMTVTSFKFARKRMTSKNWKRLHTWGIYFLWAYAFSVYWYALFYYESPDLIDYVYYWSGALALALRQAAWLRKRNKQAKGSGPSTGVRIVAVGLILLAAIGLCLGSLWTDPAHHYLGGYQLTLWLDLYMPYWPFIPFLPLFLSAAGAALFAKSRT